MCERLPVPGLSEAGIAVMHQLSVSGERPAVLLRAWRPDWWAYPTHCQQRHPWGPGRVLARCV